jgi:hypothetical protein
MIKNILKINIIKKYAAIKAAIEYLQGDEKQANLSANETKC